MYVLENPVNTEKSEGTPDNVDWEVAQKEIAQAKGFATGFGSGLSKGMFTDNQLSGFFLDLGIKLSESEIMPFRSPVKPLSTVCPPLFLPIAFLHSAEYQMLHAMQDTFNMKDTCSTEMCINKNLVHFIIVS